MHYLKCNSVFMCVVNTLDVPIPPVLKLFLSNLIWKKTKINFVLFTLLETKFMKPKWLTCKTYCAHWCVMCHILHELNWLKWQSYIYNALDVCTVTCLNTFKEPTAVFFLYHSLVSSRFYRVPQVIVPDKAATITINT